MMYAGMTCVVACVPKTIDNDISTIDRYIYNTTHIQTQTPLYRLHMFLHRSLSLPQYIYIYIYIEIYKYIFPLFLCLCVYVYGICSSFGFNTAVGHATHAINSIAVGHHIPSFLSIYIQSSLNPSPWKTVSVSSFSLLFDVYRANHNYVI